MLIFCLLVIVIGAFVLAAWAQMLSGRIHSLEAAAVAQQRRISLANSRSLAQQYLLERIPLGTAPNSSATLASNWGRFSLAFTATNTLTSTNQAVMLNPFSPFGAGGYVSTPLVVGNGLVLTIEGGNPTNGGITVDRNFHIRSRSPLLGGFPLALHTNAAATNFQNLVVATNASGGSALVFASPSSINNAPSATNYVSTGARIVRQGPDSTANAPQLPIALPAITSGASGYGGQLDSPLARSAPLANMSDVIATVVTNTIVVSDILKEDGTVEYRSVGPVPAGMAFNVVPLDNIETQHGPSSMLSFGPAPTAPPQQTGPNAITYNYFNNDYKIKYASDNVQYWKNPGWETINAENEILSFHANGTITVENIDTSSRLDFNVAGQDRAVLFMPPAGVLMVFTQSSIYFNPVSTPLQGTVVFRKSEYFQPGGVAFVAIPGIPPAGSIWTVDETILSKFDPSIMSTTYRCQFPEYNIRIYELDVDQTYTISDTGNVPVISIDPDASVPFQLVAGSNSDMPLLHYFERNPITVAGSNATVSWRKWLTALNANTTLNPTSASSSLLFAFLDDDPLALVLENDENERQTALVLGEESAGATITAPAGRTWNLAATFLDTPVTFNAGANFNIVGGIRSNRNVTASTNSVTIFPNTNPAALEPFLDRVGWLESWQQ